MDHGFDKPSFAEASLRADGVKDEAEKSKKIIRQTAIKKRTASRRTELTNQLFRRRRGDLISGMGVALFHRRRF